MYVSNEGEEVGCGDGAEEECGVRGDASLVSRGRGDVSEGSGAVV